MTALDMEAYGASAEQEAVSVAAHTPCTQEAPGCAGNMALSEPKPDPRAFAPSTILP